MNRVTVAPAARSDLRKIWFYTAENWSTGQADRYVSSIVDAFDRLASGDAKGRPADQFRPGLLLFRHRIAFRVLQTHLVRRHQRGARPSPENELAGSSPGPLSDRHHPCP